MKPINEYTMQECLDRLDDVVGYGYDRWFVKVNISELTWRINTLLYEQAQRHDARVDALENEINALRDKYRWIPVEERMPTMDDLDDIGRVHVFWKDRHVYTTHIKAVTKYFHTHWRRIDKPEANL